MKTNLLFFTKGRRTQTIGYYDSSHVKVGEKTLLTLAHFGVTKDGSVLPDAQLPVNLVANWRADEANAGSRFPATRVYWLIGDFSKGVVLRCGIAQATASSSPVKSGL